MNNRYSQKQKRDILARAAEVGAYRARKEFGYPKSVSTVIDWAKASDVKLPTSEISKIANDMKTVITSAEKNAVLGLLLDSIVKFLEDSTDLTPKDIRDLTAAYKELVSSHQLLENKATEIVERYSNDISSDLVKRMEELDKIDLD